MQRTILFDFDGVLADSMVFHAQAWQEAVERLLEVKVPASYFLKNEGMNAPDLLVDLGNTRQMEMPEERIRQVSDYKDRLFVDLYRPQAMPGAKELIEALKAMQYRLGVATGSTRLVTEKTLESLAIRTYFQALVTSEDVGHGKPDPEPYQKLLEKLGGDPETAIVIENAPLGIQSARAAGLICLAITSTNDAAVLEEASLVLPGLDDIRTLLEHEYELAQGKGPWLFREMLTHE